MSEGPDERKETNDLDEADDGVDEILNSAEFQDLVARQDEQIKDATDAKRWADLQRDLTTQYGKVGTELYNLDQLDNPDSDLSEQNFKDYLTERAKARYTSSSDGNPFSNIHEMNKGINNDVKNYMDSQKDIQTRLQMGKSVPLADDKKGSTGKFEIRFTKPWEDQNERKNIKINNGQPFDTATPAEQKDYIKRQEANFKLTESKFSKSFDNFKDAAENNKSLANFVVRHRIEKIKAKAAAEKARSANFEGSAEPPTDNEKVLLSNIEKQANKAEKSEKTAVENNEATQDQLDDASNDRVELSDDLENLDDSSNDGDDSKQGGGWLKWLAKLLASGGGGIAALLAIITFFANKLADKNSGCYMRITQGTISITKSKDCCGECLSTESTGWVEGSILLTNCKMGDRIWYNFIPGANEIGSDWDDEYVGCRTKTLGVCTQVDENNCTGAPQRKSDQFVPPGSNPVFMDVSYDRKQCAADSNQAFCVGTENKSKYCTLSSDILEDRLGISSLKGLQANNQPVLPQLSKRTSDGVNVSYRYHKFDPLDGTDRILKCIGCCAKKTGTSMLWFIGILIGLFALYKFIEFEFDEHEGAIHARVKKN